MISLLYHAVIYDPLFNALIALYNTLAAHDLGLAIVGLTIAIRIVLFPVFHAGARQQALMQRLQPKIKHIQDTHRDNRQKQGEALMALYKEHGANPITSVLLLIVQLPILIALYQIFIHIFEPEIFTRLYSFVSTPGQLNATLLGLINLKSPSILLVIFAALTQFVYTWLMLRGTKSRAHAQTSAERMSQQMAFIGPLLTIIIFIKLPAAVSLYWATSSLISALQQYIVDRTLSTTHELGNIRHNSASGDGV